MGVSGSGWEWVGQDGSGWEWVGARLSTTLFMELLKKVAPLKTKYLRATYSKLKYNKQRNLFVTCLEKLKEILTKTLT